MPLVSRQKELAMQSDNLTVAQKATADLLDRGGVGALVEAKVRQSLKAPATTVFDNKTHISIGFLESRPGDPPCAESENAVVWTNAQAYAEYEAGRQAKLAAIDTEVVQNGE